MAGFNNEIANTIIAGTDEADLITNYGANASTVGGAGNDYMSGGNGNDTLWGGAGNDTLFGGAGADAFIYVQGESNDVIKNFDNSDMLLITGAFSASYDKTAKTVAFDFYGGSITLKNFTASSFNVNGLKYGIKGNNFVRK